MLLFFSMIPTRCDLRVLNFIVMICCRSDEATAMKLIAIIVSTAMMPAMARRFFSSCSYITVSASARCLPSVGLISPGVLCFWQK